MTIEQAAALRVILKLEHVGKTGKLLKLTKEKPETEILQYIIRNSEIWCSLDTMIVIPMLEEYRKHEAALDLTTPIEAVVPTTMMETLQAIVKGGEYTETLAVAKSNQQTQLTLGSMIHMVLIDRNVDALKRILQISEQPGLTFFPMKAPEGKPN